VLGLRRKNKKSEGNSKKKIIKIKVLLGILWEEE
jgi:hypothetical protein